MNLTRTPADASGAQPPAPALGVALPNFGNYLPGTGPADLVEIAVMAEQAGISRVVVADHVVMGSDMSTYPWGDLSLNPTDPFYEPLTVLSAMASRTSRIRLATGILIAPLRNPVVLAKTAATLDHFSNGRLDLGVGVGWQAKEYEACGVDFEARWGLLTESLEVCAALWGEQPVSHETANVVLKDVYCVPRPYAPSRVPTWLGGGTSRPNLRRLAQWCDGWIPIPVHGATAEDWRSTLTERLPLVATALADVGRDPGRLRVSVSMPLVKVPGSPWANLEASLATVPGLVEAGATDFSLPVHAFCRRMDEMPEFLRSVAQLFAQHTAGMEVSA